MNNNMIIGLVIVGALAIGGILLFSSSAQPAVEPNDSAEVDTRPADGVTPDPEMASEMGTIVDIASENEDFSTLVTAVAAADLVETLSGPGPFTVFAPTNAAFDKVPAETLDALLADQEALTNVLTYHVVAGKVMASDVVELTSATTVQGQDVTISVVDGQVKVNDATVVATDIEADNGVIHVIDTVILPE